jgi:glycerophosphoryl diester phosphodiesterase
MIIFAAFFRTGVRPPVYAEADPSTDASHQTGVRPHVETKTLDELEKYKDCRDMFIGATETLWQLAEEAKAEGFRTILLSQANGTKENVGCLQKYLFEVWVEEAGPQHALEPYYSILSGADGIITDRPETIQSALNEILSWTKDSTILLRSPLIIGYGGLPSVAPMDSLEGLNMAIARHMPATEVGVFFTKDGVPIVAHRDNLLELTGQDVNISDLTENEVTSYRIIAGNTTAHQQCLVTRFKDFLSAIRGTDHILYVSLSTDEEQLISFCYELVSDLDVESQVIFISPGDSFSTIFTGQGSDPLPNSLPEKAESPQSKLREGEQLIFTKNAIDFTDFLCELTPKDTELSIKLSEDGTALSGVKYGTAVILYKYTDTIPGTGEAYTLYSQPFTVSINSDIGERIMFFTGIAVGVIGLVIIIIIIVKRPRAPKFKPVPMSKD